MNKFFKIIVSPLYLVIWYTTPFFAKKSTLWIFGEGEGYTYKDNSKYLYEYVLRNNPEINAYWITRSEAIFKLLNEKDLPVLKVGTLKCFYISLLAKYVFISHKPCDVTQIAIRGSVQIWLWHGVMMKHIGLDANAFSRDKHTSLGHVKSILIRRLFPYTIYRPSYVVNTSYYFTNYFMSAFGLQNDNVLITGYPRNDVLFEERLSWDEKRLTSEECQGKTILYLPTWRNRKWGSTFNPFKDASLEFDVLLDYLDETNSKLFVKSHPYDILSLDEQLSERVTDLSAHKIELYALLREVDVLITDYSSVYFDYLLLDKPVILAPFDYIEYMQSSRPLYYDYMSEIVGEKCMNWTMVVEALRVEENVDYAKNKFHEYADGNSSKRIVELVKKL